MGRDGTLGGENRPGSGKEIVKIPHTRCKKCGLTGVPEVVTKGACRNLIACGKRARRRDQAQETKTPPRPHKIGQ